MTANGWASSDPDPHVGLIRAVLAGFRTPQQRAGWLTECLPQTCGFMFNLPEAWELVPTTPLNVGHGRRPRHKLDLAASGRIMSRGSADIRRLRTKGVRGRYRRRICNDCGDPYWPRSAWGRTAVFCHPCIERRSKPRPRTCKCGVTFIPTTGWQQACDDCRARRALPPHHRRPRRLAVYREKPCRDCGQCFAPIAGRQWYCDTCSTARHVTKWQRAKTFSKPRICVVCHREYTATASRQLTCSPVCRRERERLAFATWWREHGSETQRTWYRRIGKAARQAAKGDTPPHNPCWLGAPGCVDDDVPVMAVA